jgi:hypothetical protein
LQDNLLETFLKSETDEQETVQKRTVGKPDKRTYIFSKWVSRPLHENDTHNPLLENLKVELELWYQELQITHHPELLCG